MSSCLRVRLLQFFNGCKHDIAGKTALLDLEVTRPVPDPALVRLGQPDGLARLNASGASPGLTAEDWVAECLIGDRGSSRLADTSAALIVALQLWARVPVYKAQVLNAQPNRISLAVPWHRQQLFRNAVDLMIAHMSDLADSPATDPPADLTAPLSRFLDRELPGGLAPNTIRFARSAMARNMPVSALNQQTLQIGWGAHARKFRSSFTDRTGSLAERLARDKYFCLRRLKRAALPVPAQRFVRSLPQALAAAGELGWPVVLKPVALDQGRGVHVGITSSDALSKAYQAASKLQDHGLLIEEFVPGNDHRILVVNGRMMMASQRIPGGVIGDGRSTVKALLDKINADPRRGADPRSLLIRINHDDEALACLASEGLTLDSILEANCSVPLRRTANISTGGTAIDVSDQIHPDNRAAAIRAARIVGLDIAGIDFLCRDISVSYHDGGGAICEVNAQPGFRTHWLSDPDRDINGEILDALFADQPARIPTVAIAGTTGKATTAMLLHHIWQSAGRTAGVCTTAGTWIGAERISALDLCGQPGAELLLSDPATEAAVLELPHQALIRFGQACDRYDVVALLNGRTDHPGQTESGTAMDMARLNIETIRRARTAVVVNAEDPSYAKTAVEAGVPRCILVAVAPDTPALARHLSTGGDGIFVDNMQGEDRIIMARGQRRVPVMKVADIPATQGSRPGCSIRNAMFAIAVADAQNLTGNTIRTALASFGNTYQTRSG